MNAICFILLSLMWLREHLELHIRLAFYFCWTSLVCTALVSLLPPFPFPLNYLSIQNSLKLHTKGEKMSVCMHSNDPVSPHKRSTVSHFCLTLCSMLQHMVVLFHWQVQQNQRDYTLSICKYSTSTVDQNLLPVSSLLGQVGKIRKREGQVCTLRVAPLQEAFRLI